MNSSASGGNRKPDERADVIVVLGAAVWPGGLPSPALRRRLLHGTALVKEGMADVLVVTGGLGKCPPTEACVMKRLAVAEGIPQHKIILEEEGTTTLTSVRQCLRIMCENEWKSAVVVSDSYHLFRSVLLFRLFGVRAFGSAAKGGREANGALRWWYYHIRELMALPWTLIRAALHRGG
ncbi:MAG: YdcF family protein [Pseudomonadota bacterium]